MGVFLLGRPVLTGLLWTTEGYNKTTTVLFITQFLRKYNVGITKLKVVLLYPSGSVALTNLYPVVSLNKHKSYSIFIHSSSAFHLGPNSIIAGVESSEPDACLRFDEENLRLGFFS